MACKHTNMVRVRHGELKGTCPDCAQQLYMVRGVWRRQHRGSSSKSMCFCHYRCGCTDELYCSNMDTSCMAVCETCSKRVSLVFVEALGPLKTLPCGMLGRENHIYCSGSNGYCSTYKSHYAHYRCGCMEMSYALMSDMHCVTLCGPCSRRIPREAVEALGKLEMMPCGMMARAKRHYCGDTRCTRAQAKRASKDRPYGERDR